MEKAMIWLAETSAKVSLKETLDGDGFFWDGPYGIVQEGTDLSQEKLDSYLSKHGEKIFGKYWSEGMKLSFRRACVMTASRVLLLKSN